MELGAVGSFLTAIVLLAALVICLYLVERRRSQDLERELALLTSITEQSNQARWQLVVLLAILHPALPLIEGGQNKEAEMIFEEIVRLQEDLSEKLFGVPRRDLANDQMLEYYTAAEKQALWGQLRLKQALVASGVADELVAEIIAEAQKPPSHWLVVRDEGGENAATTNGVINADRDLKD